MIEKDPDLLPDLSLASTDYATQRASVTASLDQQTQEMFAYVKEIGGMDPYPQPLRELASHQHQEVLDELSGHKLKEKKRDTEILEKDILHWTRKFSLHIRQSTIDHPEAGLGKVPPLFLSACSTPVLSHSLLYHFFLQLKEPPLCRCAG